MGGSLRTLAAAACGAVVTCARGDQTFGGPGPWPTGNVTYGQADGLLAGDLAGDGVIGFSTDETQNQWVATRGALYVLRPGDKTFRRYAAKDGLHLQSNPVRYCDLSFQGGDRSCPIFGAASDPGISEITGGGPNEVFVGYFSRHNWGDPQDGTWGDPFTYYTVSQTGASGTVTDMVALPDGRLAIGTAGGGVTLWNPATGASTSLRAGRGLADNAVNRMELDRMVDPPVLHVSTDTGASAIRVFP